MGRQDFVTSETKRKGIIIEWKPNISFENTIFQSMIESFCILLTNIRSKLLINRYSSDQMQGIRRMSFDRILNTFSAADEHVYH